jgi:FdhD protein
VDGVPLIVTMRTPGDDIDLAAGFLFTAGLLPNLDGVHEIRMCDENVAAVTLVGFLRGATMNVYTGTQRVTAGALAPVAGRADSKG